MAVKYAYHPGNVSHSSSPEVAVTMESFARAMGITLVPLSGATSCGAGIVRQANRRLQLTLNARTFAMVEAEAKCQHDEEGELHQLRPPPPSTCPSPP